MSPITMRKVSGKFEKMQFLGHFWAIFENIDFRASNQKHPLAASILSFYAYKNHFKKRSYIRSSCSKFTI